MVELVICNGTPFEAEHAEHFAAPQEWVVYPSWWEGQTEWKAYRKGYERVSLEVRRVEGESMRYRIDGQKQWLTRKGLLECLEANKKPQSQPARQ